MADILARLSDPLLDEDGEIADPAGVAADVETYATSLDEAKAKAASRWRIYRDLHQGRHWGTDVPRSGTSDGDPVAARFRVTSNEIGAAVETKTALLSDLQPKGTVFPLKRAKPEDAALMESI